VLTRRSVAAGAVALLTPTAGCGFITGEEPLRLAASLATVPSDVRSETGYEETDRSERTRERSFSAGGQTREVAVTNRLTQYERRISVGPLTDQRAALLAVLSSPAVEVLGETFNPLADLSERQLLERFDSGYEGLTVGERVGERTVTVLDQPTTVEQYEGTARIAGAAVDVFVHVLKTRHEDDFVVCVAVYPQRLLTEGDRVVTLVEGLDHPVEA